jgi:AraC family transcriptional regulator
MEDYGKRILKVLIYIEDHIHEKMKVEELARVACYSPFHFQRFFRFIIGESVHKYVRRLRMERAAQKLQGSDQLITEIALKANFETPSAFTKAFKQCMGESPRNFRKLYKEINMANKKFKDLSMIEPDEIKNVEEIPVFCIRRTGNYDTSSKEAWDAMKEFIKENNLHINLLRYFSMGYDDPKIVEDKKLRFDVCISIPESQKVSLKGEAVSRTLKGGKYAIFICKSPLDTMGNVINEAFDRIFLKWLPNSKENYDEKRICFMEHWGETTKIYVPLI